MKAYVQRFRRSTVRYFRALRSDDLAMVVVWLALLFVAFAVCVQLLITMPAVASGTG